QNACTATGSTQAPGAPSPMQQMQAQNQATFQNSGNQPSMVPVNGTAPPCMAYGANGQCTSQAGAVGPSGSTCLRFVGQQCAYYGQPPATAGAAPGQAPNGLAPQAGLAGQPGLGATNPLQTAGLANSG